MLLPLGTGLFPEEEEDEKTLKVREKAHDFEGTISLGRRLTSIGTENQSTSSRGPIAMSLRNCVLSLALMCGLTVFASEAQAGKGVKKKNAAGGHHVHHGVVTHV